MSGGRMEMEGTGRESILSELRGEQWASLRMLIRGLEEEHDLQGLASVTEMGLLALRQLCERPTTCSELDELLEGLRRLRLDAWEMGEEQ
jgi:hypothetical protein